MQNPIIISFLLVLSLRRDVSKDLVLPGVFEGDNGSLSVRHSGQDVGVHSSVELISLPLPYSFNPLSCATWKAPAWESG